LQTLSKEQNFMLRGAFFFLVMGLAASAAAQSGTWKIDPNHSSAQFSVRHLGVSTVRGAFTKVNGSGTYDSSDPAKTSLEANIEASSVDTRVEMRDNDLRSPNFLTCRSIPPSHSILSKPRAPEPASYRSQAT